MEATTAPIMGFRRSQLQLEPAGRYYLRGEPRGTAFPANRERSGQAAIGDDARNSVAKSVDIAGGYQQTTGSVLDDLRRAIVTAETHYRASVRHRLYENVGPALVA